MLRDAEDPKPITREELEGMTRTDVQRDWSKIKRRLKVSIPEAKSEGDAEGAEEDTEHLTPRERMARGHERTSAARLARRGETSDRGGDDGDED